MPAERHPPDLLTRRDLDSDRDRRVDRLDARAVAARMLDRHDRPPDHHPRERQDAGCRCTHDRTRTSFQVDAPMPGRVAGGRRSVVRGDDDRQIEGPPPSPVRCGGPRRRGLLRGEQGEDEEQCDGEDHLTPGRGGSEHPDTLLERVVEWSMNGTNVHEPCQDHCCGEEDDESAS